MNLKLLEKKQIGENVNLFIFQPESPVTWKAGQYLRYHIDEPQPDDRGQNRFFTIASAPSEQNIFITTRFVPDGGSTFKKALRNLNPGDEIQATGPNGAFVVEDPNLNYVFMAGGIGITPFRSIIKDLNFRNLPINVTLMYANRNDDVVFKAEFEEIAANNPNFKIRYFIGDNQINEQAIRELVPDLSNSLFYISGAEPMVQSLEKLLEQMGVSDDHIKRDYFPGYTQI